MQIDNRHKNAIVTLTFKINYTNERAHYSIERRCSVFFTTPHEKTRNTSHIFPSNQAWRPLFANQVSHVPDSSAALRQSCKLC